MDFECPGLQALIGRRVLPFIRAIACAAIACCADSALASGKDLRIAGLHVVVWAPVGSEAGLKPLVLFSHGYGGCAVQSKFLMEAFAADGFWVFAPDHRDARCSRSGTVREPFSMKEFGTPEAWDERSHADRRDDMKVLVAALRADPRYRDHIDFAHIGLVGHSLGGYTVLGLAGAWPGWRMPGVSAVLALSPYSQPFNVKQTIGLIAIPVMFQGGTRDFGTTPAVSKQAGSYDEAHAPKYYVEFDGAGHFVWTDLNARYAKSICAYSLAFFEHYVRGDPPDPQIILLRDDVSMLRFDSELGSGDLKR